MHSNSQWPPDRGKSHPIVHRSYHDFSGPQRLTTSVLLALDSVPELDMKASGGKLYEHVDPDALDALFAPVSTTERTDGRVVFSIAGYEVEVGADGEIVVRAPSRRSE